MIDTAMHAEMIGPSKLAVRPYPQSDELVGFVKSLPFASYDKKTRRWTMAATPLTARLLSERGYGLDGELAELSSRWYDDPGISDDQPHNRKLDSWRHQCQAYTFGFSRPASMQSLEMGCGKTKVAVDLMTNWGCRRVLILCPKAVLPVWEDQFERFCPIRHKVQLLDQKSGPKKLLTAMNATLAYGTDTLLALTINYESAWRPDMAEWLLSRRWDCVLLDESHKIKAPAGKASVFCGLLGLRADRRLCLTGTPMGHSPLDLYGQYRFLEPAIFGTSFTRFRSRYAKMNPIFKGKVDEWINQDELQDKMATIAFRVKSDDVLDLPEQVHHELPIVLGDAARRVYDELEAELVAELDTGETVAVDNALTKLLRLQQVTSGFLPTEQSGDFGQSPTVTIHQIDEAKAEALAELLEELPADEPFVCFCKFRHDLDVVGKMAAAAGRDCYELSGRANTLPAWQQSRCGDVLAVQIQSGGAGIDLTRARYAGYYSLGYSLTDYEQSLKRVHRPGQSRSVHYYHFVARKTVDRAVYVALRDRKKVIEAVLEVLKRT